MEFMRNSHNSIYDILNDPRPSPASHAPTRGAPDMSSHRRAFLSAWNENKRRRTSRSQKERNSDDRRRKKNGWAGRRAQNGGGADVINGNCAKAPRRTRVTPVPHQRLVKAPGRGVMECEERNGGAQKSECSRQGASPPLPDTLYLLSFAELALLLLEPSCAGSRFRGVIIVLIRVTVVPRDFSFSGPAKKSRRQISCVAQTGILTPRPP